MLPGSCESVGQGFESLCTKSPREFLSWAFGFVQTRLENGCRFINFCAMKNKLPGSQRSAGECPYHKTIRKQQGNRTLRGHAEMNLFQMKEAMRGEIPVLKRDHRGTINPNLFRPKNQWTRYPAYCNHCRAQFTSEESCLESPDKKFYFGMV